MKVLTIAVPAYNAEKTLGECLDSMVGADPRLEVVVVNDGSVDATSEIAHGYADRYPGDVLVIDKENGGHGSGINAGIDRASGAFFKVVDADDRILTQNLSETLDALEVTSAEVVVTGYQSINAGSGTVLNYSTSCEYVNMEIGMEEFSRVFSPMEACQNFHGYCYRTSFYRSTGLRMTEGVFFEDQEYAILPLLHADRILLLQYYFYQYRLGREGQSVDIAGMAARSADLEQVIRALFAYHRTHGPWKPAADVFFTKRMESAVTSYYAAVLVKSGDRKAGCRKASDFRAYLQEEAPAVAAGTEKKYRLLRKISRIPNAAQMYAKLFDSKCNESFKRHWTR